MKRSLLSASLLSLLMLPAPAQAPATPPAAKPAAAADDKVAPDKGGGELDLSKFPGQIVDEVIVPVPSEIFSVLDKLGDPDWKAEVFSGERPRFSDSVDVALVLGATVADGFIAVQAEDVKTVENVGREVLALATALGVRDDVLRHCQSIEEGARDAKWDMVRSELDATEKTVRDKMIALRDGAVADCVSVGGWLRGTQVVTGIIGKDWSADRSDLLFQPDLADYFNDSLEEMLAKARHPEKLKEIADGVARLREIMQNSGEVMKVDAVKEMNGISNQLVKLISTAS